MTWFNIPMNNATTVQLDQRRKHLRHNVYLLAVLLQDELDFIVRLKDVYEAYDDAMIIVETLEELPFVQMPSCSMVNPP
jgi:hypothetical protein